MTLLRALLADTRGSMVVETAIVAPVLALLALGAFQVSAIIARQQELQSGAAEAVNIALASSPTTADQRNTLKSIIQASLFPGDANAADKVTVTNVFRCGTDTAYVNALTDCGSGTITATYLRIVVTDTYTPQWTRFGVGSPFNFSVTRTVQIG